MTIQSSTIGDYEPICTTEYSQNIYGHVNLSTISYLYYHEFEQKWLVSPQIGDLVSTIGISSTHVCPEFIRNEASLWQVFSGEV